MNAGLVEIAQEMVILFFIIGIGYIAKKSKLMTEEFDRSLSKLIVNIALPGMILGSVLTAENLPGLEDIILTFVVSCASYLIAVIVAYLFTAVTRISWRNRGVFKFMLCFGNVGFIGFPVLSAIYGPKRSSTPRFSTCRSTSSSSPWERGFSRRTA